MKHITNISRTFHKFVEIEEIEKMKNTAHERELHNDSLAHDQTDLPVRLIHQ
jgi:hypothetical protein